MSCNPSTGNITATSFNVSFFGTVSNASNIALSSDNTNGTYFIPFSKTNTSSNVLYVDDVTGPLTYNPSTGGLTAFQFICEILISSVTQSAFFSSGILTVSGGNLSLRNLNFTFSGTSNTMTSLNLAGSRNNGTYYVALQNNGTGNLTINTGLGANIKTTYSSAVIVPTTGSALMTINTITLNGVTTTIVDVKVLT